MNPNKLRVKRIGDHHNTLPLPAQHHYGDAGFDLRSAIKITLQPNDQVLIPIGFAVEIPHGFVGIIKDRSSIASKQEAYISAGVIDSTYRGEVHVCIRTRSKPIKINIGDKIAQMVVVPFLIADPVEVIHLTGTKRGQGGFGSTGAK